MSDTPETDKFFRQDALKNLDKYPAAKLCRKIERERDDARKELEVSRDIVRLQREFIEELKGINAELARSGESLISFATSWHRSKIQDKAVDAWEAAIKKAKEAQL